jgi:solute carrier family 25 phosphate transporter 3
MGDVHDSSYYAKCMMGGIFACGLTHAAICPLDIVKCRKQANPELYPSIREGFKILKAQEGVKGYSYGWAPTLIGYGAQGFCKFGFYEVFKDVYKAAVGAENEAKYKTVGWAVSSACAEFIADIALCPFEAVKVKIQTSDKGTFPTTMREGWPKMMGEGGWGLMYRGIKPLWCRQIPYTIVKFVAFEKTVRALYAYVFTAPRDSYSKTTQLMITFMAGYWAGIFCAIISHPADTMVSIMNKQGGTAGEIYSRIGFNGLWNGLGARIIMVGTLTGLQWWIYDTFKVSMGLQASGK